MRKPCAGLFPALVKLSLSNHKADFHAGVEYIGIWITSCAIAVAVWILSFFTDRYFAFFTGTLVLAYYSLNHVLDDNSHQPGWKKYYQITLLATCLGSIALLLHRPEVFIRYAHSWPAAIMAVLYLIVRKQEQRLFAWVRALLVSATAATFLYDAAVVYASEYLNLPMYLVKIFLACWTNVLISSLLDRSKDQIQHRVMLTDAGKEQALVRLIVVGAVLVFMIDAFGILRNLSRGISGASLYVLVLLNLMYFRHAAPLWIKRWLPDAFLWLAVL